MQMVNQAHKGNAVNKDSRDQLEHKARKDHNDRELAMREYTQTILGLFRPW